MFKRGKRCIGVFLVISLVVTALSVGMGVGTSLAALTDGLVLNYTVNQTFNGTSNYIDKTADLTAVSMLTQGSIAVRFKSTSTAMAKTFLSASHTADPSSNISFTMNNGTVYFENRENGVYATQMGASGTYNDGNWHTAILAVDSSGTKIYVDGASSGSSTSTAFFPNVTSLNGMWIGRNVDNGGGQWYYAGDMDFVKVYNRALTISEAQELSGVPAVPTGLTGTGSSNTQINVAWNASVNATGYDLEVDGTVISSVTSPYAHAGLVSGSTHMYRIRAKGTGGTTPWSTAVCATAMIAPQSGLILDYATNRTFNGTSDYIDKTADLSKVSGLTQGTIAVRFKSTSTAIAKTFLSASHTADPSSNISFTMNNGTVYFENRENGVYATQMGASGTYNDGIWHTAVLKVDSSGTKIYVDSVQKASSTSTAFFSNVTSLNGMWVGRNVDSGGGQWYYNGAIDFVKVYNRSLTDAEIKLVGAVYDEQMLFDVADGRGYAQYRIPSIAVSSNGTVLVACEARAGDDQSPTDIVFRRSTDGGETFSNQVILAPGKSQGNAEMNPMLLAENTGSRVHLLWGRWTWGNCRYFIVTSTDNGATWGATREITSVLDAYKNTGGAYYFPNFSAAGMGPGHGFQLTDGTLVVPIYMTTSGWSNSTVATIYSTNGGTTWNAGSKVPNPSGYTRIHENMMVQLSNGSLLANMRNPVSDYRAISTSSGVTGVWSTPYSDTTLIDPVCHAGIHRFDASSIVFTNCANMSTRTNMTIRFSYNDCATWTLSKQLYAGLVGYSDVSIAPDKTIFVFYEKPACPRITLARFNKTWVENP